MRQPRPRVYTGGSAGIVTVGACRSMTTDIYPFDDQRTLMGSWTQTATGT